MRKYSSPEPLTPGKPQVAAGDDGSTILLGDLQQAVKELLSSTGSSKPASGSKRGITISIGNDAAPEDQAGSSQADDAARETAAAQETNEERALLERAFTTPPPQQQAAPSPQAAAPPPPLIEVVQELAEAAPEAEAEVDAPLPARAFAGLDPEWLVEVQSALEALGYDLTCSSAMSQLANDGSLVDALLSRLIGKAGVHDVFILKEMIRRWQAALKEQMELELELKKKKQVPVWRCAACGRYGCPVAPYIESYQELDG